MQGISCKNNAWDPSEQGVGKDTIKQENLQERRY